MELSIEARGNYKTKKKKNVWNTRLKKVPDIQALPGKVQHAAWAYTSNKQKIDEVGYTSRDVPTGVEQSHPVIPMA